MKYKLKSYTIWEQGPRPKQEDSLFPGHNETQDSDRLFILCDGMGGHSAGEVASQTVCEAMSESIFAQISDPEGSFTDDNFAIALDAAFNALDEKDNGAYKKMGTTLTFLKLHNDGCTIAHIGDSRVYHIRPGKTAEETQILHQTYDHSLVNDLIKIGELTPEEAKTSRQRNVITRAMQPLMDRRPRADIYHSQDIRPGDYFMLCSDGILEQMEDENIKYIFSEEVGDAKKKIETIIKVTEQNHDNHTAILVEIKDVIGKPAHKPIATMESPGKAKKEEKTSNSFTNFMQGNSKLLGGIIAGVAIGLAVAFIILPLSQKSDEPTKEKPQQINIPTQELINIQEDDTDANPQQESIDITAEKINEIANGNTVTENENNPASENNTEGENNTTDANATPLQNMADEVIEANRTNAVREASQNRLNGNPNGIVDPEQQGAEALQKIEANVASKTEEQTEKPNNIANQALEQARKRNTEAGTLSPTEVKPEASAKPEAPAKPEVPTKPQMEESNTTEAQATDTAEASQQ